MPPSPWRPANPWAGRATTQGVVIYGPAEDSLRTVRDRLRRRTADQRHGHDHDHDHDHDGLPLHLPLHLLSLSGEPVSPTIGGQRMDLNDPELVAALRAVVVQHGASFVVLDCLRELHSVRENESDDMTLTMRPLRQLAHELNVAIIVVHHASKGAVASSRGSTAIAADCDTVATWTGSSQNDESGVPGAREAGGGPAAGPGAREEPLRATLAIRGRDVPRVAIPLEVGPDLRFRLASLVRRTTGAPSHGRILTMLADGEWRTVAEMAAIIGMSPSTIRNMLPGLLADANSRLERQTPSRRADPYRYRVATEWASDRAQPLPFRLIREEDEANA